MTRRLTVVQDVIELPARQQNQWNGVGGGDYVFNWLGVGSGERPFRNS